MSPLFGVHLVKRGLIDTATLTLALERQLRQRPLIGQLGLKQGVLTSAKIDRILEAQRDRPITFGAMAVELEYVTRSELLSLLRLQAAETPSLVDVLVALRALPREVAELEAAAYGRAHPETDGARAIWPDSMDSATVAVSA